MTNLSIFDFHSQPQDMSLSKPLSTKLLVFLFVFWFPSPAREILNVTVCKGCEFFSLLAGIIWENFNKQPWIENCEDFHSHDRVVQKANDMSAADWRYQTLYQTIIVSYGIFSCVLLWLFIQGWKSLSNAAVYMIYWFSIVITSSK